MPKTIVINDVKIHEVQIAFIPEQSLNVLYSLTDKDGKEYSRQWRTFKGARISNLTERIEKVIERAIEKVKEDEGM